VLGYLPTAHGSHSFVKKTIQLVQTHFNFMNHLTNLHEISYELFATGGRANAILSNFLPSVTMLGDTSTTEFQLW
jgi:hypothetical protein